MRKINSDYEILKEYLPYKDGIVIDVGCGTGELVRWMTSQGIIAIGIDVKKMIKKAREFSKIKNEEYMIGEGQQLPFDHDFANAVTYIASFHHIPSTKMKHALEECRRVLKPNGKMIVIEPISQNQSYYEIARLVEDEAKIQNYAYQILKRSDEAGLSFVKEETLYLEKSFQDYINLLNKFVDSDEERKEVIEKAREKTEELSRMSGIHFDKYLYKSIARLIILENK